MPKKPARPEITSIAPQVRLQIAPPVRRLDLIQDTFYTLVETRADGVLLREPKGVEEVWLRSNVSSKRYGILIDGVAYEFSHTEKKASRPPYHAPRLHRSRGAA